MPLFGVQSEQRRQRLRNQRRASVLRILREQILGLFSILRLEECKSLWTTMRGGVLLLCSRLPAILTKAQEIERVNIYWERPRGQAQPKSHLHFPCWDHIKRCPILQRCAETKIWKIVFQCSFSFKFVTCKWISFWIQSRCSCLLREISIFFKISTWNEMYFLTCCITSGMYILLALFMLWSLIAEMTSRINI